MDLAAHQVTRRIIDETVAGERALAGKNLGDDVYAVVSAIAGTGVADVVVGFIRDGEGQRLQSCQAGLQQVDGAWRHQAGRAFLNGLTVTPA